jgi:recombination-promoting nuclease RpnB
MTQHISKPHDNFFKTVIKHQQVAREFFETHLPKDLHEVVDLNCLELQSSDYYDGLRSEHISDAVYRTKLQDKTAYIHLAIEHQSTFDPLMPFRMEQYRCLIIDQYRKQNPDTKTIPLVIPLVLYHGTTPWTASTDIRDIIDAPQALIEAYAFKPFLLIDLNTIEDAELKKRLWSGAMELALKHIFANDILPYIQDMLTLLKQLEQQGDQAFVETVLVYLLDRGEMDETAFLHLVQNELSPELGERIMTVSEQLIAKGMQKGIHLAKLEDARKMLVEQLDEALIAKITNLSLEEIRAEATKLMKSTHH